MSIINLVDIRDEAVKQIKSAINKKEIHIAEHPGQFNEAEIKRLANHTPAILTSLMRYTDEDHTVHFVSWVLYRATSTDRLYNGALKIVSALMPIIGELDAGWSIGGGEGIDAECLYSGTLDQINITLWGVKWNWRIADTVFIDGEGGCLTDADLEFFEGYDATHHVGNSVAEDIVNLEVENASTD